MAAVPSIGRADSAGDMTRVLYERYAPQLFRYCLHQLGSREEAEDAVQSTFLNAFRGIRRGVVPERESAWLFKIAQNVCLSRRRSTWRRGRVESKADFQVVEEVTPAPSRLADELVGLQDALERMPPKQRRAILLREWQGLSYSEIAAELEVSQTAVETLIFRARRSLAQGLAEPPRPVRERRLVRGVDLGNLVTALKSLLLGSGAAAVKVAAVATVVGTVAVATPLDHGFHHVRVPAPAAPAPPRAKPVVSTPATVHHAEAVQPVRHPAVRPDRVARKAGPAPSQPATQPQAIAAVAPPPADAAPPAPADPTPPAAVDASPPVTAEASPPPPPPGHAQEHAQEAGPAPGHSGDPAPAVSAAPRSHGNAWGQGHDSGPATGWGRRQDDRSDQGPVQDDPPGGTSDATAAATPPAAPAPAAPPADGSSSGAEGNGDAGWNGDGQGQGDAHGHGHSAEDYAALASSSPSSSWSRISASVSS